MSIVIDTAAEATLKNQGTGAKYKLLNSRSGKELLLPSLEAQVSASTNYYTCERLGGLSNGSVLTSGVPTLVPIWLPVGLIVTKIGFFSATTAAS